MEQQFWKITEFSKELEKPLNTVDSWFKQLEENRVHYVSRKSNERVFDDLDLQIGQYIKSKRNEKWALEAIFNQLPTEFQVRPFPPDEQPKDIIPFFDKNELRELFKHEIQLIVQEEIASQMQQLRLHQSDLLQTLLPSVEDREREHSELLEKVQMLEDTLKQRTEYIDQKLETRDARLMEAMQAISEKNKKKKGFFSWIRN